MTITSEILDEVVFNPADGTFTWVRSGRGRFKRAGARAGGVRPDGYTSICVNGEQWLAHRLAWLLSVGEEIPDIIDHIDGDKSNNKPENLRDGTGGVNEMNSKPSVLSPYKLRGVRDASNVGMFQAYASRSKKFIQLYYGPDFFEACCARKSWEVKFWENVA